MLIDLVPEQIAWVFSSVVVRQADIAQRRDVLLRFLKATAEGNHLALHDAVRAKAVLAKELRITDAKILDISYEDFRAQSPPYRDLIAKRRKYSGAIPRRQSESRGLHRYEPHRCVAHGGVLLGVGAQIRAVARSPD